MGGEGAAPRRRLSLSLLSAQSACATWRSRARRSHQPPCRLASCLKPLIPSTLPALLPLGQAYYDLDWRSLGQLVTHAGEDPRNEALTLSIYRKCGTAKEIGVIAQNIINVNNGPTFSLTQSATVLQPVEKTLIKGNDNEYATRHLSCINSDYSVLADFSVSPITQIPPSIVAVNYGSAERTCCALEPSSSPLYRDGSINPGGLSAYQEISASSSRGTYAQYMTEVFWCVTNIGTAIGAPVAANRRHSSC